MNFLSSNVVPLGTEHLILYVFDVSGHGVPSAMVTFSVAQALQTIAEKPDLALSPSRVLQTLEKEYPFNRFDKFFTIAYAVLEIKTGRLTISSAGHPFPFIIDRTGKTTILQENGGIIGMSFGMPVTYPDMTVTLEPGSRLWLYSDGVTEAGNNKDDLYGDDRLAYFCRENRSIGLEDAVEAVFQDVRDFLSGNPLSDDFTLLAVEYRGAP